jgi:adenylate cyclase
MISLNSSDRTVTRSLTGRYLASLSAVALVAIVGQAIIQKQLTRQESDLKIVRMAQERQVICQRLLKELSNVSNGPGQASGQSMTATDRETIKELIEKWKGSREILRDDIMTMVSDRDMGEVDGLFTQLEPATKEILGTAQRFVDQGTIGNADRTSIRTPQLIQAERDFTQVTDEIITWYSQKVKDNVSQLKFLEFVLLGGTLLLLGLEGLFIFRPAVDRLRSSLHKLSNALSNIQNEQEKSEKLLLNILPRSIADRLKVSSDCIADGFPEATVLFADIVGFTELSSRLSPQDLVARLNQIFSAFDTLAEKYGLEKIKTIGDAYMVVGGLPKPSAEHSVSVAKFALEMRSELQRINESLGELFDIRIGINSGPVVAGVIGIKKFTYDLWGDTVNVASRMESHGKPGEIHISESFYEKVRSHCDCESRGTVIIKGKGEMKTYWLRSVKN